jgi:hypothetical protein
MNEKSINNLVSLLDEYKESQEPQFQNLYFIIKSLYEEVNKKISTTLYNTSSIAYVETKYKVEKKIDNTTNVKNTNNKK